MIVPDSASLPGPEGTQALVKGLDLDGVEGDEVGRADLVGAHVGEALQDHRFRVDDDGLHVLRSDKQTQHNTNAEWVQAYYGGATEDKTTYDGNGNSYRNDNDQNNVQP